MCKKKFTCLVTVKGKKSAEKETQQPILPGTGTDINQGSNPNATGNAGTTGGTNAGNAGNNSHEGSGAGGTLTGDDLPPATATPLQEPTELSGQISLL